MPRFYRPEEAISTCTQEFFPAGLHRRRQRRAVFSPGGEGTVIPTELEREAILEALAKIALSRPNDAIALALDPERKRVGAMDLWGVAEFKRAAGGAVEVKFADRAKAVSLLLEALGGGEDGMGALLEALGNCGPEGSNSAWE